MSAVIVLNKNYQYWTEAPIKKVLKWFALNKIEILAEHDTEEIGSIEVRMKMPMVVRLLNFVGYKPKRETVVWSPEAVYQRDADCCMYYHFDDKGRKIKQKLSYDEKTIDHIMPLSRGGGNTFENTVCACRNCNIRIKKNRTPDEAGLELIRKPFAPRRNKNDYVIMRFSFNKAKKSHIIYLEKFLGIST